MHYRVAESLTVYPRVCGGTGPLAVLLLQAEGLSPRVRGNHENIGVHHPQIGSIPACAGEPQHRAQPAQALPVYPRVCGGTKDTENPHLPNRGLSPRVRGNLLESRRKEMTKGSIPACAGEPEPLRIRTCQTGVYPRVCGGTVALRAF